MLSWLIHRHTGGLEIDKDSQANNDNIHRHTGGLEIYREGRTVHNYIHRHTGGLEIVNITFVL